MIYVYQGDSAILKAEKSIEEVLLDLPKSMHNRALRYKREEDAYNYILGRLLLKKGLEDLGLTEQFEKIEFQKDGKPYLENVFFNISHSGTEDINNSDSPMHRFFWYWTRKECIIKALGVNLSYLHQIELDAKKDSFFKNEKEWFLKNIDFGSKFFGAICSEHDVPVIQKLQ